MSEGVTPSPQGAPAAGHNQHFIGGFIVAVLALLLLWATFYISSPFSARSLAIAVAVIAVGAAAGLIPCRSPQDFFGGLVLVEIAIFALIASAELPGQRGFAFGPGTAPRLFAGVLAGLGFLVTFIGAVTEGPAIERYRLRGPLLVIASIILFAALIRPFGLIIATYSAFIFSVLGSREMRWLESVIAGAVMTAFCVLLFAYLLNLPFQLWPQANGPTILLNQFHDLFSGLLTLLQKAVGR
ncbi:MAG: tripartite tricarboxylate transporter TctB family protein [Xanthobacteraceae bacterium]